MRENNGRDTCCGCGEKLNECVCEVDLLKGIKVASKRPHIRQLSWREIQSVRWKDPDGMIRKYRNYPLGIFGLALVLFLICVWMNAPSPSSNPGASVGAFVVWCIIVAVFWFAGFRSLISYDVGTWRHKPQEKINNALIGASFFLLIPSFPVYWWLKSVEKQFLRGGGRRG